MTLEAFVDELIESVSQELGSRVKLPDLPITQVYRVALDANNPVALYGGFQDNGTNRTVTGALDDWDDAADDDQDDGCPHAHLKTPGSFNTVIIR